MVVNWKKTQVQQYVAIYGKECWASYIVRLVSFKIERSSKTLAATGGLYDFAFRRQGLNCIRLTFIITIEFEIMRCQLSIGKCATLLFRSHWRNWRWAFGCPSTSSTYVTSATCVSRIVSWNLCKNVYSYRRSTYFNAVWFRLYWVSYLW